MWERNAVCYPCVIWDEKEDLFKMWYSAGDIEKPLAIGYAVSRDGEHWEKPYSEPVLKKDNSVLEKERVGACHVLRDGEQYVMFYTAWQDAFKSRICLARSEDGICWERHPTIQSLQEVSLVHGMWKRCAVRRQCIWRTSGSVIIPAVPEKITELVH